MTTEERRRRRFTESFRKEQVLLIENGKVTIGEVSRQYEVRSDNVRRWLKKYGSKKIPETIIISSSKDFDKLKDLEKENQELKQYIGEQQIKLVYLQKVVELAREQLGEEFEKK